MIAFIPFALVTLSSPAPTAPYPPLTPVSHSSRLFETPLESLQKELAEAEALGDEVTAALIRKLIEQLSPPPSEPTMNTYGGGTGNGPPVATE